MHQPRVAHYPLNPVFLDRWSPRAFDPVDMPTHDLMTILEAGRWAPSAYNIQPWRFLYALRGDRHWATFIDALNPFNKSWAANASALIVVLSDTRLPGQDGEPGGNASYNSFDAGAAWAHLALQAQFMGYHAHAMAGLAFEAARDMLQIPARFKIEVAIAIGRRAAPEKLPAELAARETPSPRRPLDETAFAGAFPDTGLETAA